MDHIASVSGKVGNHTVCTCNLPHLEEVRRVMILQSGEIEQKFSVGCIRISFLKARKVHSHSMNGATRSHHQHYADGQAPGRCRMPRYESCAVRAGVAGVQGYPRWTLAFMDISDSFITMQLYIQNKSTQCTDKPGEEGAMCYALPKFTASSSCAQTEFYGYLNQRRRSGLQHHLHLP